MGRSILLLRHEHDLALPKGSFRPRWVEHSYLTVVLARRKLIETDAEAERHHSQPAGCRRCHRCGLCLEHLCLPLVKTHEGDERLRRCSGGLVSLQVDIQIAPSAEGPGYAGDQFLAILD